MTERRHSLRLVFTQTLTSMSSRGFTKSTAKSCLKVINFRAKMMRNNTTADKSCQKHWKENRQTRTVSSFGFVCRKTSVRNRGCPKISRFFSAESLKGSETRSTVTLKEGVRKISNEKVESLWRKHLTLPETLLPPTAPMLSLPAPQIWKVRILEMINQKECRRWLQT